MVGWLLKGATSQVAGSPAVLDRTVIVLDRTIIVLDRTVIVLDRTIIVLDRTVIVLDRTVNVLDRTIIVLDRFVIVLDRSVIAIYGIFSLNFLRLGGGSDRLWLLRAARHTSVPAYLPSQLSHVSLVTDMLRRPCPAMVCFLGPGVAPLTSQQHASVSQGRVCSDSFTCCHTEVEVAPQTFYLTQSQYTDTGPTSPSVDPTVPGAWRGSHWSVNFEVTGMTRPGKIPSLPRRTL